MWRKLSDGASRSFVALLCLVSSAVHGRAQAEPEPAASAPSDAVQARASSDERARAHFVAGESYFASARWSDAVREFALAYELSRRPEMLVNLARTHERAGQAHAALADWSLLLAQHPNTSYRGEAEEHSARLRAELSARAKSEPATRALSAAPAMKSEPRVPSWTTLALGAATVAVGAVALGTGLRAHAIYRELEGECPDDRCDPPFEDRRQHGRALARASTGLSFATLALATATTALWLYEAREHKRRAALGFSVGTQPMMLLRGRF